MSEGRLWPPWLVRGAALLLAVAGLGAPVWMAWLFPPEPLGKQENVAVAARPALIVVPVEQGSIGSPADEEGHSDDESLQQVTLTYSYAIAETEVTQGQYERVMGENPSHFKECGDDCPAENVTWFKAVRYCNALSKLEGLDECYRIDGEDVRWPDGPKCNGYRLPTEAEWEIAARAGSTLRYVQTADTAKVCDFANVRDRSYGESALELFPCDDGFPKTAPVKSKSANAWHLCDMIGNVDEWVWDRWFEVRRSATTYPLSPFAGSARVFRGGGWDDPPRTARVASRDWWPPSNRDDGRGFRVARSFP